MNWEQLLINVGVVAGFLALIIFWLGIAMWMRVDANKRGLVGWPWVYVGLLTGPLGLFVYLFYRGNRPVLEVVHQRDRLINQTARAHAPIDFDPTPAPDASSAGATNSQDNPKSQ